MFEFSPLVALALPVLFLMILVYLRDKIDEYIYGPIFNKLSSLFTFKKRKQQEAFEFVLFVLIGVVLSIGLVGLIFLITSLLM